MVDVAKGVATVTGVSGRILFYQIMQWISIIIIIFWLFQTVPHVIRAYEEDGGKGAMNSVVFDVLAPIVASDNALYYSVEEINNNGLHQLEKPTKSWCGVWFCSEWFSYYWETGKFLLNTFFYIWFTIGVFYGILWIVHKFSYASRVKEIVIATVIYLVLCSFMSPIMYDEMHVGEPIAPFSAKWMHYIPAKGLFSLVMLPTHSDWFFYNADVKVFDRIKWNSTSI